MNAIAISVTVGLASTLISLAPAVAIAWYLERTRSHFRSIVQILVALPLVLPPVVVGYLLLHFFSPRGTIGSVLQGLQMPVAFHWLGAVVAAAVVGFPLFVFNVALAIKGIDERLERISFSLGRGHWSTFTKITFPLALRGILSGAVLSFARGLGEFGATIILAGRIPGETETIPLAIYAELDAPGGETRVGTLVIASILICLVSIVISRALDAKRKQKLEI